MKIHSTATTIGVTRTSAQESSKIASSKPGRKPFAGPPAARQPRRPRRAAQLLTHAPLWDSDCPASEHTMLCDAARTPWPLVAWLEMQLHEHGPQPWAALREGLRGHAHEAFALRTMAKMKSLDQPATALQARRMPPPALPQPLMAAQLRKLLAGC